MGKWSFKRIVAAVVSGGFSEGVAAVTNHDPNTGESIKNPGGNDWNEREANNFAEKMQPKADKIKDVATRIIGTEPENVKPNHKKDWEKLLAEATENLKLADSRSTSFNNYKKAGFGDKANRDGARWHYIEINKMYDWALKADDKRHIWSTIRDIDKAAQAYKTVNLAPLRAMGEVFIRLNVFNIATIFKIASVRKPKEFAAIRYKWKQLGGNRTKFDNAINAGYKKKPILGKKMNISDIAFTGNDFNTEGETKGSNVSTQDLQNASNTINSISENIPQKAADPAKKTLEIPGGVMAAIPALSTAFGATLGASVDRAATAAAAGAWGGIVSALFGVINAMKIPLGPSETQPEFDASNLKQSDIDNANSEVKKTGKIIRGVSNLVTIPAIVLMATGIAITSVAIYKNNKKNKKS